MDSVPHWNNTSQTARVKAGLKGGPFFSNPETSFKLSFAQGCPDSVYKKLEAQYAHQGRVEDAWVTRYPNAKLK